MCVTRLVFERGLELSRSKNSVKMATEGLSLVQIFAAMRTQYNVRPILLTETINSFGGTVRDRHAVLTLDGLDQLNIRLSSLILPQGHPEATYISMFRPAINVQYTAGGLIYHCQQLAILYTQICNTIVGVREISPIEGNHSSFGDQCEPYYEVEALITLARRTYDSLRYIIWKSFGRRGDSVPSNFIKTLAACDRIPERLRSTLEMSWEKHGVKMTAYRDCMQHYVPVTFDLQSAFLERVAGEVWSLQMRLPDNPEVKSQAAFRFNENVDALTYGWELANEVFVIAADVFSSIPLNSEG